MRLLSSLRLAARFAPELCRELTSGTIMCLRANYGSSSILAWYGAAGLADGSAKTDTMWSVGLVATTSSSQENDGCGSRLRRYRPTDKVGAQTPRYCLQVAVKVTLQRWCLGYIRAGSVGRWSRQCSAVCLLVMSPQAQLLAQLVPFWIKWQVAWSRECSASR